MNLGDKTDTDSTRLWTMLYAASSFFWTDEPTELVPVIAAGHYAHCVMGIKMPHGISSICVEPTRL